MDPSQGPVNNVQAFLGMSLTDKISVMVSVRGFCLFVFYIDLLTILTGNFWKFLKFFDQHPFDKDICYLKVYDIVVIAIELWVDLHSNLFLL